VHECESVMQCAITVLCTCVDVCLVQSIETIIQLLNNEENKHEINGENETRIKCELKDKEYVKLLMTALNGLLDVLCVQDNTVNNGNGDGDCLRMLWIIITYFILFVCCRHTRSSFDQLTTD
jgi:hypothetical protein